jgi:hypothetical protein
MSCPIKPVAALWGVEAAALKLFLSLKAANYRHRPKKSADKSHKTILHAKMFGSAEIRWQSK